MQLLAGRRSDPVSFRGFSRETAAHRELIDILDHLPYMAAVLTTGLELVHANRMLLDTLGLDAVDKVLARRPGELLECVHSRSQAEGCGGAEGCRHCSARQAIADCLASGERTRRDVRVSARSGGRLVAYDLRVTVTPLSLDGRPLLMVFFEDIGAQKRREHLESIFIHDLLNTVGGLQLLNERLKADSGCFDPRELDRQIQLLTDEIRAQQLLIEAERGGLERHIQCVPARQLLDDALAAAEGWGACRDVTLIAMVPEGPVYLATDPLLARRVLLNAVKNAVEAAAPGEVVRIGVSEAPDQVVITVWNRQAMPEAVRHQVFQRSFSTKGRGRGLGTYSMRLLMENYLDGRVTFTSEPIAGTTFFLHFPSLQSYLAATG